MHLRHISTATLLVLSACNTSISVSSQTQQIHKETRTAQSEAWENFQRKLHKPSLAEYEVLGSSFYQALAQMLENPSNAKLQASIQEQLLNQKLPYPVIAGKALQLEHTSAYDTFNNHFTLIAPKHKQGNKALFIFLEPYEEQLPDAFPDSWKLFIPSRPGLNYQLLAEGDFWSILHKVHQAYPQLVSQPRFLVGKQEAADSALLLANNYRFFFSGVAFSGANIAFSLPNLDEVPVWHFPGRKKGGPYSGKRLIERLGARGNHNTGAAQSLSHAAQRLIETQGDLNMAPFSFFDYRHSRVNPWLQVLSKSREPEPATVWMQQEGNTLYLETRNVDAIEIQRSQTLHFPKNVANFVWNDKKIAFPQGEGTHTLSLEGREIVQQVSKAKIPSSIASFFQKERVHVLYQSRNASPHFLAACKSLAQDIARMRFLGLPSLNVSLPCTSIERFMEDYDPAAKAQERYIVVGQAKALGQYSILKSDPHPLDLAFVGQDLPQERAFSLTWHSPHPYWALCADDLPGLDALKKRLLTATIFYENADLLLWTKNEGYYQRAQRVRLNGWWQESKPPTLIMELPPNTQKRGVWQAHLEKLLLEESGLEHLISQDMLDSMGLPPTLLSYERLVKWVPEKHFVRVTLKHRHVRHYGNRLLAAVNPENVRGFEGLIEKNSQTGHYFFVPHKVKKIKELSFICDVATLNKVSPLDLSYLELELLPFSLREMLLQDITGRGIDFGKELVRLSQKYSQKEEGGEG